MPRDKSYCLPGYMCLIAHGHKSGQVFYFGICGEAAAAVDREYPHWERGIPMRNERKTWGKG